MLRVFLFVCLFSLETLASSILEAPVNPIDFEQNPSGIEWKKIETQHFQLIFPQEILKEAQRVAFMLEEAYPYVTRSLEVKPPKISLILQNQSTMSNGFVTLAPRRSEWYVTPSVDPELGNTEWLKTLAVHEFRHVVQFQKIRRGFNVFLEIILGEIGQAAGLALTLPPWFLEGDAVGTETALTQGGRGRLPLFERDLRTLLLSGMKFDYDKAHMRSFKDYVPNHYVYGYFLTTFLRNKYGDLFLSQLANESAERSWNPLSFYNATEKLTKESFEKFYKKTMAQLLEEWTEKFSRLKTTPYAVQNLSKRKGWTNYLYPQVTSDGKILALKKGLSHIDQFVLLDGDKEKTILYPAPFLNEYPFKLRNDRLAFLDAEIDPRWGYRDYTRLKVYDLKKYRVILEVPKTKWRSAVLNPEGEKILVVEWDEKQTQSLLTLNLKGETLSRLPLPSEEVLTSLDWISEDEVVAVIRDQKDLKSIIKISLRNGNQTTLLPKTNVNIGYVAHEDGHVLFESPVSGIDNIFMIQPKGARQITSSAFGAYAPTLDQGKLIYNDYSAKGMNIVKKDLPWEEEQSSSDSFVPFYEKFASSEDAQSLAQKLNGDKSQLKVEDYSQVKAAPNLHSWMLLAPPLSATITAVGYSRDVLNKFSLSAGAEYHLSEKTTQGFVSAAWSHLYPVFDLRAAYGGRRQDVRVGGREIENRWEEGTFEAGIQVPWRKIVGRFTQNFTLRAFAKIIKVTNKISSDRSEVNDGALYSPGAELSYSWYSRMAQRDLLPPWGFSLYGRAEEGKDITGVDQKGSVRSLDSKLYLPGLTYHHSFYHQLAYEKQRDDFYQYSSFVFYPRGTKYVFLQEFLKYSANYTLPLFYPDWHWSRYLYLQRVSANLFYDDLKGRYQSFSYHAASTGWEVLFDTYFFRLRFPITWGIRGSYILDGIEKENNYEVFLNTGLASF